MGMRDVTRCRACVVAVAVVLLAGLAVPSSGLASGAAAASSKPAQVTPALRKAIKRAIAAYVRAHVTKLKGITAGTGLTGGGSSGSVSLSIAAGYQLPQGCSSGQLAAWNGSAWSCSAAPRAAWSLTGNAGTNPATDYVGTSDSVPLNLDVDGIQGLELQPPGDSNYASTPNLLGGYSANSVTAGVSGATIAGGGGASGVVYPNSVTADFGSVGGGQGNAAGNYATVPGGEHNTASGTAASAFGSTNTASDYYATAFGFDNSASGLAATAFGDANTASGNQATAFGSGNTASNAQATAFGYSNTATGNAAVAAGEGNTSGGQASFALGEFASAPSADSFVWSDGTQGTGASDFADTGAKQFDALASNGFNLQLSAPGATYTGCKLTSGSGWACTSDANAKHDFAGVSDQRILRELARMPIRSWSYKIDPTGTRHIGPTAQAFKRAFSVGNDPRSITLLDEGGVALASVKGLYQLVAHQRAVERRQQMQITLLRREVGKLLKR